MACRRCNRSARATSERTQSPIPEAIMASQIQISYVTSDKGFTRQIGLSALTGKTPQRLKKIFPKLIIKGFSEQPTADEMAHILNVCKMNGWELPEKFTGAPDELPPPAPMGVEQKIAALAGMAEAKDALTEQILTEDESKTGLPEGVVADAPETPATDKPKRGRKKANA